MSSQRATQVMDFVNGFDVSNLHQLSWYGICTVTLRMQLGTVMGCVNIRQLAC